ncbi:hypothetical protein [Oryza sativa Japonica Group]|uniref:Uncharacterized protein n=1 Tax=Oryza sativa subsp. japonica TaxID=39947 RepID=Q5JL73_ORYSJ|nr:hypothetical protein [Oryza sativa Japonica Group]
MPGRPKKERRREPHEKPKATRVSKVGTIIMCRRCKGIGHNKTTCAKRNTGTTQASSSAQSRPIDKKSSSKVKKRAFTTDHLVQVQAAVAHKIICDSDDKFLLVVKPDLWLLASDAYFGGNAKVMAK